MAKSFTIQKTQSLTDSSNYALLRQKGLEYIEKLGSKLWTDYNTHDPGITFLEAIAYALTELGFITSFDIKDLVALPVEEIADADGQYPSDKRQALYTARNILTVNPCTDADFRKLLINIDGIKNGWLNCKKCACDDIYLYANCTKSILQYTATDHQVIVRGLYDVLLEFEEEEKSGNLNSGKIKYNFSFKNGVSLARANVEMRLPSWAKLEQSKDAYQNFRKPKSIITDIAVLFISASEPVIADIPSSPEQVLDNALRKPVFAKVEITFKPDMDNPATEQIVFMDVPINIWFRSTEERRALELPDLKKAIMDKTPAGIFPKYLEKIKKADKVIAETIQVLHEHRNLAEDYCTIKAIEVEDIAICADMEIEASLDIEAVLAEAYYRIDEYMSPDLKFYSLQQLLDAGKPVDEIFEGPALSNGFIDCDELEEASLRTILYASDVINMLMDIPGVKSIKNFVFVRYDNKGYIAETQAWSMPVTFNHQPRLYVEGTKVMVFKNGLPFLADSSELFDSLQVIKGKHTQPKYSVLENDLAAPHGNYYELDTYYAVQNSLPFTYGVGEDGLPDSASDLRKAQAKQLKAYLLFFEQLLVNYLSQLANLKELFAVDNTVTQTYFSRLLKSDEINGLNNLYNGITDATLQGLVENNETFLDRRNRFLDHLLARFAENFNDYALMLYSYTEDKAIADSQLISNKISFLKAIPELSHNRAKSFNYKSPAMVCNSQNTAGLVERIKLLLGYGQSSSTDHIELFEDKDFDRELNERSWRLVDKATKKIYLSATTRYGDPVKEVAEQKAMAGVSNVFRMLTDPDHYKIKKVKTFTVNMVDDTGEVIATRKQHFKTLTGAEAARDEIIALARKISVDEEIFIVEHVLLRPRNIPGILFPDGDPLLSVCLNAGCSDCDERDPYSFRITVVLNGEDGLVNKGIEFRRFAEQTIRMETPAHLGLKICWVGRKELKEFGNVYCKWLAEFAKPEPDAVEVHHRLDALLKVFGNLNNVYPQATLHDCIDGNDDNRVFLGRTAIIGNEKLDEQIKKKKEN